MITDPYFYAVAIPAVLLLGVSKSWLGTGFGSLAAPMIALAGGPPINAYVIPLKLSPLAPIGVWIGVLWARRISQVLFYRFLYAGMLLTGLKLVWDGLLA